MCEHKQIDRLHEFMDAIARQAIPNCAPDFSSMDVMESDEIDLAIYQARRRTQRKYGMWSMVDSLWTRDLADWIGERICLEVMAGAGWLAKALTEHGVQLIATDYDAKAKWGKRSSVHPIKPLDACTAVASHPEAEVLLVSWPPYNDAEIESLAEAWGSAHPIIYIGEAHGGCTATESFCTHFQVTKRLKIPQWPGLHDEVMIGYYQ